MFNLKTFKTWLLRHQRRERVLRIQNRSLQNKIRNRQIRYQLQQSNLNSNNYNNNNLLLKKILTMPTIDPCPNEKKMCIKNLIKVTRIGTLQ